MDGDSRLFSGASSSINRKHDPPKPTPQVHRRGEEPTRTCPGLQLPAPLIRSHAPGGDAPASPPAASPSRPRPGPASPWTLAGTSVPVARPGPRSTGNNGGGVVGACVAGSTPSSTGGSASPLPLREEPGAAGTRQPQLGPQRPRPEPPAPGLRRRPRLGATAHVLLERCASVEPMGS